MISFFFYGSHVFNFVLCCCDKALTKSILGENVVYLTDKLTAYL